MAYTSPTETGITSKRVHASGFSQRRCLPLLGSIVTRPRRSPSRMTSAPSTPGRVSVEPNDAALVVKNLTAPPPLGGGAHYAGALEPAPLGGAHYAGALEQARRRVARARNVALVREWERRRRFRPVPRDARARRPCARSRPRSSGSARSSGRRGRSPPTRAKTKRRGAFETLFFAERARSGRARGAAFPAQATEARRSEEATAVRRTLAFETERVVAVGYSADGSRRRRGRDVDIPW